MTELRVLRYGVVRYERALRMQHALRQRLWDGEPHAGWIVAIEHNPVVTLGKRGREHDIISPTMLEQRGVDIVRVDRGGEATYHGPGQLVLYPIVRLDELGLGVVDLVRSLAAALGDTVAEYGVPTHYDPQHPGLWTDETPSRKMGSVGMRVSRGISTHGAALNVNNDLIPFSWIVACGMPNAPMTRLADYVDSTIDLDDLGSRCIDRFCARIGATLRADEEPLPDPALNSVAE